MYINLLNHVMVDSSEPAISVTINNFLIYFLSILVKLPFQFR